MATETVVVESAPGYRAFLGDVILRTPAVDSRGELAAVAYGDGEIAVVPARCVRRLSGEEVTRIRNARLYRREWSVKTGRSEREVYVPADIRPRTVEEY